MLIRYGTTTDLPAIQRIARQHDHALGFVRRAGLERAIAARELFVAVVDETVAGFVDWHARRDGWQTVYTLATDKASQGQGIGRALLYAVPCPIRLKCPVDLPSNEFYRHAGLTLAATEPGRKRALNVWELRILSIIVRGGNASVPGIARTTGNAYGLHHHDTVYDWPYMIDSDPERCDWAQMMQAVTRWRPVQALTADYFPGQRDTMLAQVADLRAAGVLRIAVCPKFSGAVADIPPECIVAVSLRTNGKLAKGRNAYAGFMPDWNELRGRRVHLLGGSPKLQKQVLVQLQAVGASVLSFDGSAHIGAAGKGSTFTDGNWRRKPGERVDLLAAQTYSSANIQRELNAAAAYAQPPLF